MRTLKMTLGMLLIIWTCRSMAQETYVLLEADCLAPPPAGEPVFPGTEHAVLQRVFQLPADSLTSWGRPACIAFQEPVPTPVFLGTVDDPGWMGAGVFTGGQKALTFIGAATAWSLGASGERSRGAFGEPSGPISARLWEGPASLGLVDRWVDSAHADLHGRIQPLWMMDSSSFHGSAVAGLMAANTGNGIGLASLPGGFGGEQPRVRVRWQADPDRAVLELARAGTGVVVAPWFTRCSYSPIQAAIYEEVEALGTLVVAGAGNGPGPAGCGDGHGKAYPASLPGVLSVSSVGHRFPRGNMDSVEGAWNWEDVHDLWPLDTAVQSHTHNEAVDLLAPGHGLWTTMPGDAYAQAWGTSFAAPLVGAAAAAVRRENPCLRPDEVRYILRSCAVSVDHLPENAAFVGQLGAGRLDAGAALLLAKGESGFHMPAGTDTVWTGVHRIRDSLVLDAGARLVVRGRIYFDSAAFIRLHPGSRLALEGAQLEAVCGQRWGGIRVDGARHAPPPLAIDLATGVYPTGPGHHALLTWDELTAISGADSAVVARWGGIVQGFGGAITDASCALTIRHYAFAWPGLLRNVSYAWDEASPDSARQLVRLRDVQGVRFQGGTWHDGRSFAAMQSTGLQAENASFTLAAGVCSGGPCIPPQNARFINLARGIDAWSLFGAVPSAMHLADATFENCYRAVRLSGYWLPLLERLTIDVPAPGRWVDTLPVGLYMDACPGARVRDGHFSAMAGSRAIGMVMHASGDLPGQVERNVFSGFRHAVSVLGNHGDSRDGWALRCNRFDHNIIDIHLADAWSADDGTAMGFGPSSLARSQGDCSSSPAGNRHADSGGWYLGIGAPRHTLFHHSGTAFRPKANDSLRLRRVDCGMAFDPVACAAPPILPSAVPKDSFDRASLQAFQLELGLDNGDTEGLLRLLGAPHPGAWFTEFLLSEAHPYFSDTVLLALLERYPDVSQPFFEEIFLGNAPWSERVYQQARISLPPVAQVSLQSAQAMPASPRDELFASSTALRLQAARWRGIWYDGLTKRAAVDSMRLALGQAHAKLALEMAGRSWMSADSLLHLATWDTMPDRAFLQALVTYLKTGATFSDPHPGVPVALSEVAKVSGWSGSLAKRLLRRVTRQATLDALPVPNPVLRNCRQSDGPKQGVRADVVVRIGPNPNPGIPMKVQGLPPGAHWMVWDAQGRLRLAGDAKQSSVLLHALPDAWYRFQWVAGRSGGSLPFLVLRTGS